MPAQPRVRWAQIRVGIMAIAAMIILGVLIWLLTSQNPFWESKAALYTYVHDAAGLATGAPVRLNGIPVGSVSSIELTRLPNPRMYVRITMQVGRQYLKNIPLDSVAGVAAESVLGAKFINISRGRNPVVVQSGAVLPSEPSPEIEDLMRRGFTLLDSAQAILGRLDKLAAQVEAGQGNIGKFLVDEELYNRLVATVTEFQKIATALSGGKGTLGHLLYDESLYNELRSAVQRLDSMIASVQAGQGTAGKLLRDPALYDEARASLSELRALLEGVRAGRGTVGKLITDEQLYRRMMDVTNSLDRLLTGINQGQGTLGQLVVNRTLYDNLSEFSKEMRALVRDVRANPKKFLRIKASLF